MSNIFTKTFMLQVSAVGGLSALLYTFFSFGQAWQEKDCDVRVAEIQISQLKELKNEINPKNSEIQKELIKITKEFKRHQTSK